MDFNLSFSQNVEDFTDITLIDDPFALGECHRCERVRDTQEVLFVELRQERDLPEDVMDVLLLTRVVVRQHVPECTLVDLPDPARCVGKTRRCTGTVVEQGKFSERPAPATRTDVVPIDREAYMSLVDDVEEVTDITLFDDDRPGGDRLHDHGIDEETTFFCRQRCEDKVIYQRVINELDGRVGLGKMRRLEVCSEVDLLREDILTTLLADPPVHVDVLLPLDGRPVHLHVLRSSGYVVSTSIRLSGWRWRILLHRLRRLLLRRWGRRWTRRPFSSFYSPLGRILLEETFHDGLVLVAVEF
mmetsp:Transcript_3185/g.7301  ORF Transcript_3185/g.7301 Transcript_3185/m.7301 type:complete len:301 (+) Transcript_3185:4117-5019(+)